MVPTSHFPLPTSQFQPPTYLLHFLSYLHDYPNKPNLLFLLKFTEFNFHENLLEAIAASGYEEATPVQEQVMPLILQGKDIIASAQTGTGKTAAFLLPLLQKLITEPSADHHINVLIIVPTRELAVQISGHLDGLTYFTDISSIAVYGGGDGNTFVQEKQALSKGADIVVSTPGKLISHINMGYVKLKELQYLVLDEADRMLDMGFHDDIMRDHFADTGEKTDPAFLGHHAAKDQVAGTKDPQEPGRDQYRHFQTAGEDHPGSFRDLRNTKDTSCKVAAEKQNLQIDTDILFQEN